jgi:hypothetical protein
MKKSIGIIAAVVLTTSIYSQQPDPAYPHQSTTSNTSQSDSTYSSRSDESTPGPAEYDAQSSLRAQSINNSDDQEPKQGRTLTDEEAASVLRNSTDDPDLANRNQEQMNRDRNVLGEEEPDMIYEEWILVTPEDVGGPPESESGSSNSSRSEHSDIPADPDRDNNNDEYSSQFDRETGVLNDERIYNGDEYSQDSSGAPAQAESGTLRSKSHYDDDDCEVDLHGDLRSSGSATDHDERFNQERENVGGPAQSQSETSRSWDDENDNSTVRSSGSAIDHDERYRINRSADDDEYHINRSDDFDSTKDDYRGSDAENESDSDSSSSKVESSRSDDLNSQESASDSNTIPPDL